MWSICHAFNPEFNAEHDGEVNFLIDGLLPCFVGDHFWYGIFGIANWSYGSQSETYGSQRFGNIISALKTHL